MGRICMSFFSYPDLSKRKNRLTLYGLVLLEVVAISFIIPSSSSTGEVPLTNSCTVSSGLCGPIQFEQTAIANSTISSNLLNSTTITPFHNDIIVVASVSLFGDTIVSMTDTSGSIFTKNLEVTGNGSPAFRYSIWTGFYSGISSTSNQVIIQYSNNSATSQDMALIATYRNVASVGNRAGTVNGTTVASPLSFQITTSSSGSWIVGGIANGGVAGSQTCSQIAPVPGTGLIQRVFGCSIQESPGKGISGDLEDNATALRNNVLFTYSESWPVASTSLGGAIELIAIDKEPLMPNFNNFCTTTNGLCVTTQYTINYAKLSTAPNSGTVALATGTAYCTGVTTVALTSRLGKPIQAFSNYGGFNRNVTNVVSPLGPALLVQTYITTAAPSTVFGVGLCSASGNSEVSTGTCLFLGSGGITASTSCSLGMNGAIATSTIGTIYYGFIEITPLNLGVGIGHIQFNQAPGNANAMANIALQEEA